jgi:hypothetical protein
MKGQMKDIGRGNGVTDGLARHGPEGRVDWIASAFGSGPPRWRSWLAHAVIFSVALFLVLLLFSALARLMEGFFVTLYVP